MARSPKKIKLIPKNFIVLDKAFNEKNVSAVLAKATRLFNKYKKNKNFKLYLILNSPGGSIQAGLNLMDGLNALGKIDTITLFAGSMGFQTVQNLNYRYIIPHGVFMAHKAKGGFSGEFPGQLDSRYNFWLRRLLSMDKQTVKRTKGKHTLITFRALMENEYWCEGVDCIKQGFADRLASISCNTQLLKSNVTEMSYEFLGQIIKVNVSQNNCPIIDDAEVVNVTINGKLYNWDNIYFNKFINEKLGRTNGK